MKKIKILILVAIAVILSACTTSENDDSTLSSDQESVTDVTETPLSAEVPVDLDFILEIALSGSSSNQFLLFNPTTGDIVTTYQFSENEHIFGARSLGDGYYAVHVGELESFDLPESELNFRVIIFDKQLNILDTLPGETGETGLSFFGSAVRFVDGVLFVYSIQQISNEVGGNFDPFAKVPAELRRVNVNTKEIEVLFAVDNLVREMEFIGEHLLLVMDNSTSSRRVINLETTGIIDLQQTVFLEGDELIAYLEYHEIDLEAWQQQFGNNVLERLEWDFEALAYFNLDPEMFETLSHLTKSGQFSVGNGIIRFHDSDDESVE